MSETQSNDVRTDAVRMITGMPDSVTWDDIMHQIYVRKCIESGISDSEAGRTVDVEEVRKRFGLTP